MKAMISPLMAGKTDGEIVETRERAKAKLEAMGYEFVNTLFTNEWYSDEAMEKRGVVQRRRMSSFKFFKKLSIFLE